MNTSPQLSSIAWWLIISVIALPLSGCAFGHKYGYDAPMKFEFAAAEGVPLVLLVQDARPYVISGNKSPEWVGLQRSGFGIPYGVHTLSGRPLAKDISASIKRTLVARRYSVEEREVAPKLSEEEIIRVAKPPSGATGILIRIIEWKTDRGFTMSVHYDINGIVLDDSGKQLAVHNVKGAEKMLTGDPNRANEFATLTDVLNQIFSNDQIRNALLTKQVNRPESRADAGFAKQQNNITSDKDIKTKQCSVDQIVEMTKMGLSKPQIAAACEHQ